MKKRLNKKGFTMAELLIVVAIIAVLVAIAIPVFTAQLDKSKVATEVANGRSAYADYAASCLGNGETVDSASAISAVNGALNSANATMVPDSSTSSGKIIFSYSKGSATGSFEVKLD